jgi:hypothetical protein
MEKLSALSAQYETEKAQLENDLIGTLEKSKNAVATDIIEQKASARHYVNVVNEFFDKTQAVLKDGLQARRDAEKTFTTRMMEAIRMEYEDIVSDMRAEDRKKSQFERVENHKKLESCRTAVRMDLAAMLLQQRAAMARERNEEITKLQSQTAMMKTDYESKLEHMRNTLRKTEEHRTSMRIELKVTTEKLSKQVETLEADNQGMSTKLRYTGVGTKTLQDEIKRLREEADTIMSGRVMLEQKMREENEELQMRISELEETLQLQEEEAEAQLTNLRQVTFSTQQELNACQKERDSLRGAQEEVRGKLDALNKKYAEDVNQLNTRIATKEAEFANFETRMKGLSDEMIKVREEKDRALAEKQRELDEQEEEHARVKAMLEENHRQTIREKTEIRTSAAVWLHDQINMRQQHPIAMAFHGSEAQIVEEEIFFSTTDHEDLQALHKIITEKMDMHYANSPDRLLASNMDMDGSLSLLANDKSEAQSRENAATPIFKWASAAPNPKEVEKQVKQAVEEVKQQVTGLVHRRRVSRHCLCGTAHALMS